ncbi:M48 family metalloprotease [Flavobacterium tructae]|uniref:M48 family metalloprotease n=1 Tax=Flavobacterium tructae TaxID=1114873 RepID=UPI002551F1FA|nr:M48 family metalloprotease [Flavobacterium tructae]MDL2141963.1 M48 family metalloprotease [Flavobacterium tructae]
MEIASNENLLKNFYFRKARKHKLRVKFRIMLVLFILPASGIIFFLFFNSSEYDVAANQRSLLGILFDLVILVYVLFIYLTRVKQLLPKSSYIELNQENYKEIWNICYEIIEKLDLSKLKLKIYYIKTNDIEAHITLEKGVVHLFLSRALISHSHHYPKELESILGHEFGHIVQGDSKLFLITKKAFRLPIFLNDMRLCFGIFLALFLFFFSSRQVETAVSIIVISLIYRRIYTGFNRLRKESEFLADLCSLIIIEKSEIIKIVNDYIPESNSPNYPSKKERLKSIELFKKNIIRNK